jgi:hypothetical protein
MDSKLFFKRFVMRNAWLLYAVSLLFACARFIDDFCVFFACFSFAFRGEKCAFNARKEQRQKGLGPSSKLPIFSCRSIRATAKGQKHVLICSVECFQCESGEELRYFREASAHCAA